MIIKFCFLDIQIYMFFQFLRKFLTVPTHKVMQASQETFKSVASKNSNQLLLKVLKLNRHGSSMFATLISDAIITFEKSNIFTRGVLINLTHKLDYPFLLKTFKNTNIKDLDAAWALTMRTPDFHKMMNAKYKSPKFAIQAYKNLIDLIALKSQKLELPEYELGLSLKKNTKGEYFFNKRKVSFGGEGETWFHTLDTKKQEFCMYFHNHPQTPIASMPSKADLDCFAGSVRKNRYFSAYIYSYQTNTSMIISKFKTGAPNPNRAKYSLKYEDKGISLNEKLQMHIDYKRQIFVDHAKRIQLSTYTTELNI